MLRETSELYECKHCGGLTASTQMRCPYCDTKTSGTKTVKTMGGGTETVKKSWYRRIEIIPKKVQE